MMNTPVLKLPRIAEAQPLLLPLPVLIFCLLLAVWAAAPAIIHTVDGTAGYIDQGIWLLVILAMLTFMLFTGLVWWLLKHFWQKAGLVPFNQLVSSFNSLSLWQQLAFYWASFALLLLAASICLAAIC